MTAVVAVAAAGATVFNGSIDDGTDPSHPDFILDQVPASSCAAPKAALVASDPTQLHYDTYTVPAAVATCFTIQLTVAATAPRAAYSAAYLNSFNPSNLATNYLGDIGVPNGVSAGQTRSYSVRVPAGGSLVAEVEEISPAAPALPYTLEITGSAPTAVKVTTFRARSFGGRVVVSWRTADETDAAGFQLFRESRGARVRVGPQLIPAKRAGRVIGASYRFVDRPPHGTVTYLLRLVRLDGSRAWIGLSALSS